MPDNLIGEIRRSAVVMTYGPGAIMDMRADGGPVSGVCAGLEEWDKEAPLRGNLKYQKIIERRLCKKLGKKYFRLPPVLIENALLNNESDRSALVAKRFPEWLQCPSCESIKPAREWAADPGRAYRYCSSCTHNQPGRKKIYAVPVRFAVACNLGHLDDFPWNFWLNHKSGCSNKKKLKLSSIGPGLGGLVLSCPECKKQRSMEGAFRKGALTGLKCLGKRPWLHTDDKSCECSGDDGTYRAVQRGASNLYYPVLESALDIPPWTGTIERILGDYWDDLVNIPNLEDRIKWIELSPNLKKIIDRENKSAKEVATLFESLQSDLDSSDLNNIRPDEYRVLTSGSISEDREFEIYPEPVSEKIKPYISKVVRVARLREVRVLKGFTRINPPDDESDSFITPISSVSLDWLPAIEVRGEGIFIQFNSQKITEWEKNLEVVSRCGQPNQSWKSEWKSKDPDKPISYEASPRLLMIHTFAHTLIRQLTLECGYSSASLRERLYVSEGDEGMTGLLIYTSAADSDGTLGGLQRRAAEDLLGPTILGAIQSSQWCSSDPLCINGEMALLESHSLASCHSCTMVSETSCELHNRFLDRALLVGTDALPNLGYFRDLTEQV